MKIQQQNPDITHTHTHQHTNKQTQKFCHHKHCVPLKSQCLEQGDRACLEKPKNLQELAFWQTIQLQYRQFLLRKENLCVGM
jgi:hypothetical protein